jgi:hypothetical protein
MLPSTLELLRDILREAEFLESEAQRTNQLEFLGNGHVFALLSDRSPAPSPRIICGERVG